MRDFYDGVFIDANRTNEASGRSFHIPADEYRRPSFLLVIAAVLVLGGLVWGLLR